jgi:hypothetical protein
MPTLVGTRTRAIAKKGVLMFTPRFFKTIRTIVNPSKGPSMSFDFLSMRDEITRFNGSYQEFMQRAKCVFEERGYENVDSKSTRLGEFLIFAGNEFPHLVFFLPYEMYVTTIEIQACWEAQQRLDADTSSVVAQHRFSQAATHKASSLAIDCWWLKLPVLR